MQQPIFVILAGPNGSGKTTFAHEIFSKEIESGLFVNADEIAKSIESQNIEATDIEAGRKALALRNKLLADRKSFVFETTLATLTLASAIKKAQSHGYKIILNFLWIPDPALCDFRVKERVSKGGHNIPTDIIIRRHRLGLKYLNDYIEIADEANIYIAQSNPNLIARKDEYGLYAESEHAWKLLQKQIKEG